MKFYQYIWQGNTCYYNTKGDNITVKEWEIIEDNETDENIFLNNCFISVDMSKGADTKKSKKTKK